ncbi:MAG: molybdopterin cofactor-binding domain-containing protein [Janthinobacterium lividum]
MIASRRDFLKGMGALVVSFSSVPLCGPLGGELIAGELAFGQDSMGTRPSHIDPAKLDSWLAVAADGKVTAFTGKCDFGQGMYTAQTQLVAEELCVALSQVTLVQCDTDHTPDQGHTSGSQSTPTNFNTENLALAAATAREALLQMAADHFGKSVSELTIRDGVVTDGTGRRVRYEALLGNRHFNLQLSRTAKRKPQTQWTVLGKSIPSLDRPALMTGEFAYVHSLRLPGMAHGRVVRPPSMGATLAHVDERSVDGIPGLVKVVVRENFVGVVAETQWAAIRAARALKVQWNPGPKLPEQQTFYEQMTREPAKDDLAVNSGDVDAQLTAAVHKIRARYTFPFQMHGSVGSSCAVAEVKPGHATVWSSTQSAYPTRSIVARLLDLPPDSVRVIYTRGSGCYGLNGADAVSFDAAFLSQAAVGRPVRVQFSRWDEMAWENFGSACVTDHHAGINAAGSIVAWDRENWVAETGGRPGYDHPGNVVTGMLVGFEPEIAQPGPAKPPQGKFRNNSNTVPAYLAGCVDGECGGNGNIRSERVLTHTVRSPHFTGSLRSPLRFQNTFANECFMDELAAHASADPMAFRLQHLRDPRLIGVLRAATEAAKWEPRMPPRRSHPDTGVVVGRGLACVAYEGNNGYAALVAEVSVDLESGVVQPKRYVVALDCGPISNPDGLRNQTEGGLLQGTSRSLVEEVTWTPDGITSTDWVTYRSLSLGDEMPTIEVVIVNTTGVPASGAGETAITVTPAALGNAIFDATGVRLRTIPYTPERVKAALQAARDVERKRV